MAGHAAGITGAGGVNVAVLMSLRFKDYTSMPMTVRAIIIFTMRVNVLKRRLMSVPDKKEQDGQIHGNDPLAVEQAYSRKQNQ